MKILLLPVLALFVFLAGMASARAQEVRVIKFEQLQQIRTNPADTLYVVNFWATWCKPCIKELPYFEKAHQTYRGQPVKIILVSMDAALDLKSKVLPFARKRNLQSELYLLDERDANTWIDKLEPKWSGAIPATIFFNNKRNTYYFLEQELSETELMALIEKYKP